MSNVFRSASSEFAKEVVVTLLASGFLAVVTWGVSYWTRTAQVPGWVSAIVMVALAFAVLGFVGFGIRSRALLIAKSKIQTLTALHAEAASQLRTIRESNRRIAEELVSCEVPLSITSTTTYTVGLDQTDRIDEEWIIATSPGRVFIVEYWNAYPSSTIEWRCESDGPETDILAMQIVDEPVRKRMAIYLRPPVDNTPRKVSIHGAWPNLFKDLREIGADYIEREGRRGLTASTVRVHIPIALGRFEWNVNAHPKMQYSRTESGTQQTLEVVIQAPSVGDTYRADIKKRS